MPLLLLLATLLPTSDSHEAARRHAGVDLRALSQVTKMGHVALIGIDRRKFAVAVEEVPPVFSGVESPLAEDGTRCARIVS